MSIKNLEMLDLVAAGLKDLCEEVVFVGGATTTLYIDDPGAAEPRPTEDVDCVIEISSRLEYHEKLEPKLRKLGFKHDTSSDAPVCRWKLRDLTVDVMPTDPKILGFSNQWYADGMANRISATLPSKKKISIFSLEYFVASKAEAFEGRGNGDLRTSHDFEDILFVLDGRTNAQADLLKTTGKIRGYLKTWAKELLALPDLDEALSTNFNRTAQGRVARIKALLEQLST